MVTSSRLTWAVQELDKGRQCRLRINTYQDRLVIHLVLLPAYDRRNLNLVAIAAIGQLHQSLDGLIAVDHGHCNSRGESNITITAKSPPHVLDESSVRPAPLL